MRIYVATAVCLLLLAGSTPARAESMPLYPCVCNDDCPYPDQYCYDWGWGTYCDWAPPPGIPCSDAGVDGGTDADLDGEVVPPDVTSPPQDVGAIVDVQSPQDVEEIRDGDLGPVSRNRGCACGTGPRGDPTLPFVIVMTLALMAVQLRRRKR